MSIKIVVIIGVVFIAVIGFLALSGESVEKEEFVEVVDIQETIGSTIIDEQNIVANGETISNAGSYESYSSEKIARAKDGTVVIFFHASWCPSCRALNGDVEKNVDAIPVGVTILKTDYDAETELKKKYGVTTQHTLVQVDKNGDLIKKWSGGSKLENLVSQLE